MKITKKYICFVVVNFIFVSIYITSFIFIMNGNNKMDYLSLLSAISVAFLVVIFQYPLLNKTKKWWVRFIIFFLSMNVFLFFYGELFCLITQCIGDFQGLKMVIFGNMFGHIIGCFFVFILNYLLRELFFE